LDLQDPKIDDADELKESNDCVSSNFIWRNTMSDKLIPSNNFLTNTKEKSES